MFERFFDALASVLDFFFRLVPEGLRGSLGYGFAIMGLTVLVMLLITPLTIKSTRSMIQMQRLQPEMKRLQEKYKDDREKLNQELMAFYRENQINPLGGCLPMLAQMPVFIIMYQLLRGLTERQGGLGTGAGQIVGQVASGVEATPWVFTDQVFNPAHLDPQSALYQSLHSSSKMNFLGMDLSLSASEALGRGIVTALPYFVLLAVILATGLYQNHQIRSRNTATPTNPQQQMLMKLMPFFLPLFSFGFPAGLALYWSTQNLCRIGTNAYITRSIYRKEHPDGAPVIEASATEKRGDARKSAKAVEASAKKKDSSPGTPGKSIKSQMAHQKKSGPAPTTSGSSSGSGSSGSRSRGRRSGEPRRGSADQKKK